jgi:hypothetical protein
MQYQLLSTSSLSSLQTMVNNEIRHGWEVTGGLISYSIRSNVMLQPDQLYFAQAMIRSTPQPDQAAI